MTSEKEKCPVREQLLPESFVIGEDMVGRPPEDITKLPAGKRCNAKRTIDPEDAEDYDVPEDQIVEGAERIFIGYCNQPAGWDADGDERCKFHDSDYREGGGAPKANQNAATTHLKADPRNYHENLPPEEREFVLDTSAALEDRIRRNTGDVDYIDRILARRIAIKIHIAAKASDTINRDDLTQTVWTDEGSFDKKHPIIDELRMYDSAIVSEMRQIGILDDPETAKADALAEWKEFISEGD